MAENEAKITLGLLNAIEANATVTQRSVARDLGIALGLANAYLKRSLRKGLIKVNQAPANRYAYYLTPKGFAEKSRLTAEYLTVSFNFFRGARSQCTEVFERCAGAGLRRLVLVGVGDLGEIAVLCAAAMNLELVGFLDAECRDVQYAGVKVFTRFEDLPAFDAVMITNFRTAQETYDELIALLPSDRVLAPRLLNISAGHPHLEEAVAVLDEGRA